MPAVFFRFYGIPVTFGYPGNCVIFSGAGGNPALAQY
jgi:hypothetical protein